MIPAGVEIMAVDVTAAGEITDGGRVVALPPAL